MATSAGRVLSVNVGPVREFQYHDRPAKSAIWKYPVAGRIAAHGVNLDGDDQADRKAHGGPDKAVYAYAVEDEKWWEREIGRSFAYGEFGDNLTTEGIDVNGGSREFKAFEGKLFGTMLAVSHGLVVQSWRSISFRPEDPDSTLILSFADGKIRLVHLDVPEHDVAGVTGGWEKFYWMPWRKYLEVHR